MILGIGTDLIINSRVQKLYKKYGDRFLNKILSAYEKAEFFQLKKFSKNKFLVLVIRRQRSTR